MAGNVKKWSTNPHGEKNNKFSILGGAHYDNEYNFKIITVHLLIDKSLVYLDMIFQRPEQPKKIYPSKIRYL